ncbi:MAG: aldo/keto reductase [Thermoplasmatota archaeon]
MDALPFGPARTLVPPIGQGTWRVQDARACAPALREGIRLGLTHIDTAELYERQSGSETMLGELLSERDGNRPLRDRVYLASKVLPENATADGIPKACQASLARLKTDHVDLYYHHWRGPTPLEETLGALAELVDRGSVRHIGVSNYDLDDLEEAKSILGPGKIAANQVLYHMGERGAEALLPWCRANRVALVAYSPFGAKGGFPAGSKLKALQEVGRASGLTPHQVVLAFLVRNPEVFVIPKAEEVTHVRENAKTRPLPPEAVAQLEEAFPLQPLLRTR